MAKLYGGRWKFVESIDAGGQAEVFKVEDVDNPGEYYALKRLRNPERMDRFEREIEALRRLEHENIIGVIHSFVEDDRGCYVMPLMKGGNLQRRVEPYKGDIQRSLKLLLAICDAVQAAHAAKIIHRDLKPENTLFRSEGDDSPVVSDFGICHLLGAKRLTSTGEAVGARYFMAPELEGGRSDQVGSHNDVYSLGKLLYYTVSGGALLPRESHRESDYDLRQTLTPDRLVSVESCQLEYVSRLLDHMIEESPSKRWGTVEGCAQMIRLVLRLVEEVRYPITNSMPCRFCGIGEHHIDKQCRGGEAREWTIRCRTCGHVERFDYWAFFQNNSIGAPSPELLWA